jgi:hypothetical protein
MEEPPPSRNLSLVSMSKKHLRVGLPDFSRYNVPKRVKTYQITINIPNGHKIHIPEGHKINQMGTKYTNIFHCKSLQKILG